MTVEGVQVDTFQQHHISLTVVMLFKYCTKIASMHVKIIQKKQHFRIYITKFENFLYFEEVKFVTLKNKDVLSIQNTIGPPSANPSFPLT